MIDRAMNTADFEALPRQNMRHQLIHEIERFSDDGINPYILIIPGKDIKPLRKANGMNQVANLHPCVGPCLYHAR